MITGDAAFTQRSLCVQITSGQADYVLALKANQSLMLAAIQPLFAPQVPLPGTGRVPTDSTPATSHNRGTDE